MLERCLSYRETNKEGKEREGPFLGVGFTEVSISYRLACVASVSNRVIARKVERKQKKG